ncbi:Transport protein particle subunit trs120 [Fusarium culmorum]|uniref:Transport protein particle subunit trs120 n=1 Tax=Fusarium culmorum TaxID=5516 RepID=A0A2T4GJU9_FUSCU|nr:Transport protein particle subunit trs120 [Fusarium culmorum]
MADADSNPSTATHNSPRTWLLTSALSPLAVRLIRLLLSHGDYVVACLPPYEIDHEDRSAEFRELVNECKSSRKDREGWKDRIRGIRCDGASMGSCGAAVAEAVQVFGRIDILLCCKSDAVVGTVEELSTTPFTQNLVRDQFESVFFSQVNFIKSALPQLRSQHTGHIIVLTSTGGHIGTPGMSIYTAATWALEGFCDSLAYEIAPFNIKVTVVQPNKEILSLTNRLTFAPQLPAYDQYQESAPSIRDILANVLNTHPDTALPYPTSPADYGPSPMSPPSISIEPDVAPGEILHRYPKLPPGAADKLVMETVHALSAIGGHENPPARHIVGYEAAVAVKEKLKTVTEELEDFVEASLSVDTFEMKFGLIKADRFATFVERLNQQHVVHLRDISADGRPNRNMFSPLAYPDGAIIYNLVTHVPPPSHLALTPFDLYREPLAIIALADGTELHQKNLNKRQSMNGTGPTTTEKNIRALYQELEELRDTYPKALVHHVLIFDYVNPHDTEIPMPEGLIDIPPPEKCTVTTIRTVMCDISSLLLAEMTTLAKSFEAMTNIESPVPYSTSSRHTNGGSWGGEGGINSLLKRNSSIVSSKHSARSNSAGGIMDKAQARMSMPVNSRPGLHSSNSTPGLSSTPPKSHLSNPPMSTDGPSPPASDRSTPEPSAPPETIESSRSASRDRISTQGFGAGGVNDRWRHRTKGRAAVVVGSMFLQAGRWTDSIKELSDGAMAARSVNDHLWHGKALELILVNLFLLGWSNIEFHVPTVLIQFPDKPTHKQTPDPTPEDPNQPKHLRNLQALLPELLERIPAGASELLTTVDRASILSGIATVLGPLGLHRKKAMVIRELVSVLIGGLVEARTRGAADMGIHPAAGLMSLTSGGGGSSSGSMALEIGECDVEQGIEALMTLLCKSYGIVGFDLTRKAGAKNNEAVDDSDKAVIARIRGQSAARFFGFPDVKLNILRACINFSEALPDFDGVLRFSSDLLRTSGSGVAPGPRREDASPMILRDEQVRLATGISRTAGLVQRLGYNDIAAEYWDEFFVRGIKLEPSLTSKTPVAHSKSILPGAAASRASQDVDPFIYNPFLKKPDETVTQTLVADEYATFKITLQNPYDIEVDVESIYLATEGVEFDAVKEATLVGPYRTQVIRLRGRAKEAGTVKVTGAIIKVRGCRERRFPVFSMPWVPKQELKIKAKGLAALEEAVTDIKPFAPKLEAESMTLTAIQAQPLVIVKSTTLAQSSIMILEGERQVFSVTMQNLAATPVDFMLFSFKDSTQEPLQSAIGNRDATPSELYEYELALMKKQALRLPNSQKTRHIAPNGEATFEFEILGKPGLTTATIQVDYTHLGCPQEEMPEQFYTRQVSLDLTVTVNASVELARIDALPVHGEIPQPLWDRLGSSFTAKPDEYCLLSVDLRNAWPSQMLVQLESNDGISVQEDILPGNTSRVILPVKRVYLEDPHATIPTLNPSRNRQFVVSASKISPETERANREGFWYRERVLDCLRATWKTTSLPKRGGSIDLRSIRLTTRMIEAIKIDEVDIELSIEDADGNAAEKGVAYVDEFMQLKVRVTNRTAQKIHPLVRILPALCHRPANVGLEFTRKLAWNGTLQQLIPVLEGHGSAEVSVGMTVLCRGEFEISASVEEVQVWEGPRVAPTRARSESQTMQDAALGVKERRIWHARQPCMLMTRDRK